MNYYVATLQVVIEAEDEEEARRIASTLKVFPKKKEYKDKAYQEFDNTQVEGLDGR